MKRAISVHSPDGSSVRIHRITCDYKSFTEPTTLRVGVPEGVHAMVQFEVLDPALNENDEDFETSKDDEHQEVKFEGVEAVEFTFALYDVFDHFLASVQGLAGPGTYRPTRRKHRAKWVFDVDGVFSMYHVLCFPSQVRMIDGTIWRCKRDDCVRWLNYEMKESGESVTIEDIFPDGAMHEGSSE